MIPLTFFCFRERYWTAPSYFPSLVLDQSDIIFCSHQCTICNAEPILQVDPPTNAAIGPSHAQRRAATSENPTTFTLPSDVVSHNLIHHHNHTDID